MKIRYFVLGLFLQAQVMFGQSIITGIVSDIESGEVLVGANVLIEGTRNGTVTDYDGRYILNIDTSGIYNLRFTYLGYQDRTATEIVVPKGKTVYVDMAIAERSLKLDIDIEITAKVLARTENAMLLKQRKSERIQDGISSQEINRFGVLDAASAMSKVTGASVLEGKYVVIRGLSDRYTYTQLNGITIPSMDPYKNSPQLDIIPSGLLDNLLVSKSSTPDMPGSFTGGVVNMETKSFPERLVVNFSTMANFNTQSSFSNNFQTFEKPNYNLPEDNTNVRQMPAILQDSANLAFITRGGVLLARQDDQIGNIITKAVNSVSNQFSPTQKSTPLDHGATFSVGNQVKVGKNPLGFILHTFYNRRYRQYNQGTAAYWELTDPNATSLSNTYSLVDNKSVESPNYGGMLGLSYNIKRTNNIHFNGIFTRTEDNIARTQIGAHRDFEVFSPEVFQTRTLQTLQRELRSYQLRGEHIAKNLYDTRFEWGLGWVNSLQDEPDLRFFANNFNPVGNLYNINQSNYDVPTHFFRNLTDNQFEGKFDITVPFIDERSRTVRHKFKMGISATNRDRNFTEYRFGVNNREGLPYNGDPSAYFGESNAGVIDKSETGLNVIGTYLVNDSRPENNYKGSQDVFAFYLMGTATLAKDLKAVGGIRTENTQMYVESQDLARDVAEIDRQDFLPSLSLIYNVKPNANLRAYIGNTLARPNMRELAPFASFEYIGDAIFLGNPDLDVTKITNADLRFELFPSPGELLALSVFGKQFRDPIIQSFSITSNPEFRFENVDQAIVYGMELEFRKSLSFIDFGLRNFKLGTNLSVIRSEVDIPSDELEVIKRYNRAAGNTRPFVGQSPFLANANLNYTNTDSGWEGTLSFNIFGDRLFAIGQDGGPDIYEKSRAQLDLIVQKKFKAITLKAGALNLLNPDFVTESSFRGRGFIYSRYAMGRNFLLQVSYSFDKKPVY